VACVGFASRTRPASRTFQAASWVGRPHCSSVIAPIRLHNLRHCAATFAKASGADMKDIQELLGHSSNAISSDTYTSVFHELETERATAKAAAALVPRSRKAS
jgi:integrase